MSDIETGLKSRIVVNIANWLLRTFTPNYAKLLKATIICGLEWGARDCPSCRLRRNPDAVIAIDEALAGEPVEVTLAEIGTTPGQFNEMRKRAEPVRLVDPPSSTFIDCRCEPEEGK